MLADDDEVINKISELSAACVVITKQGHDNEKLKRLADLNKRTPGMPVDACRR